MDHPCIVSCIFHYDIVFYFLGCLVPCNTTRHRIARLDNTPVSHLWYKYSDLDSIRHLHMFCLYHNTYHYNTFRCYYKLFCRGNIFVWHLYNTHYHNSLCHPHKLYMSFHHLHTLVLLGNMYPILYKIQMYQGKIYTLYCHYCIVYLGHNQWYRYTPLQ